MKFLRHPSGIIKLDWERNFSIRDKVGVQDTVREIRWYQQKWIQHLERMDRTGYPDRHCSVIGEQNIWSFIP
jgi:predicted deacetylase